MQPCSAGPAAAAQLCAVCSCGQWQRLSCSVTANRVVRPGEQHMRARKRPYGVVASTVSLVRVALYPASAASVGADGRLRVGSAHRSGSRQVVDSPAGQLLSPAATGDSSRGLAGGGEGEGEHHPGGEDEAPAGVAGTAAAAAEVALPQRELLCSVRALLRKMHGRVLVGDYVRVGCIDWKLSRGVVEDLLPRQSETVDPKVANVDHALLVFALANPPFEPLQVSKFLVSMEASGLPFSLVLNKVDLVSDEERAARAAQVRAWGYDPLLVSCETGQGLADVRTALATSGTTSVVAGPSGAGKTLDPKPTSPHDIGHHERRKSSLINALIFGRHRPDQAPLFNLDGLLSQHPELLPRSAALSVAGARGGEELSAGGGGEGGEGRGFVDVDVDYYEEEEEEGPVEEGFIKVGEISKTGRGKHTTTTVTLVKLPDGGTLADTPGFSQPGLSLVSSDELAKMFPDVRALVEETPCRFSDCAHLQEPGCAVNTAAGLERYPHYVKLYFELRSREEVDTKVLQAGKVAREGTGKIKSAKGGKQRVEARLDTNKHRQPGRQKASKKVGLLQSLDE
ncbi:hypothetical protein FOA52_008083 [Chlamydomonas sp. UWO 241]|nr:hypothetical protein FOA52_008083 [Chlamydomonas sp. UWO 241]